MAEEVQTGGVMQFKYEKKSKELDSERRNAIAEGYKQAEERKKRDKARKRAIWITTIILFVIVLGYFFIF